MQLWSHIREYVLIEGLVLVSEYICRSTSAMVPDSASSMYSAVVGYIHIYFFSFAENTFKNKLLFCVSLCVCLMMMM